MDYRKVLHDFKQGYEERERAAREGSIEKEAYGHILAEIDLEEKKGTPKERVVMVQSALEMLINAINPPEASPLVQEAYDTLTKSAKLKPFSLEARDESLYSKSVSEQMDDRAPDTTEIRLLASTQRGSMVHCTLTAGQTSLAGRHRSVEEIWYVAQGAGVLWRQNEYEEREERVVVGMCFTIAAGTVFQVRNGGSEPLVCIIVTMPPWPGTQEWEPVQNHWTHQQF